MPAGVSFIVTVYNKAPYLPAVIAALAAQVGDFEREFVFVDDGSTDGSAEAIRERIKGWPNAKLICQSNQGAGGAMNTAAAAASLPFLKMVDADDLLLPKGTLWLLEALQRYDAVMSYGGAGWYDLGRPVEWPQVAEPPASGVIEAPLGGLLRNCTLGPSSMMVRTAVYREVGGCKLHICTQDYSLQFKLARRGRFAYVDAPIALAPRVAPGRNSENTGRMLHDVNLVLYEALAEIPELTPAQRRYITQRAAARAFRFRYRRGGTSSLLASALRYLRASIRLVVDQRKLVGATLGDFGVPSQLRGWRPGS
ncbi:MAG: glycosyltransferase family 2 protein [Acidobacteriota bacterium]